LFTASPDNVDFVQYAGGNGGNYQLQQISPYLGMGTDGNDLGANIVALNQALTGVE
jgi:hypothetical protein